MITNTMSSHSISQRLSRIVVTLNQSVTIFASRVNMPAALCAPINSRLVRLNGRLQVLILRGPRYDSQ